MIYLKTDEEVELMRASNAVVARTLAEVGNHIHPGVSTKELDRVADEFIRSLGAVPSFLGYHGFPASVCVSVNDEVLHGVPGGRVLRDGDIVSVDCGALKDGFHGDSCFTFCVGGASDAVASLLRATRLALDNAVLKAVEGNRLGDVSAAICSTARTAGYSVVREYTGHGIGRDMHEEPAVPSYGREGTGILLRRGMVISIEPMLCMGGPEVGVGPDGWTVRTLDSKPSAHFEQTVAVGAGKADVLSSFEYIDNI